MMVLVDNRSLNNTEGGKGGRKEREGRYVQNRCGWQWELELYGEREGSKERKRGNHMFKMSVVGNGSLNSTERERGEKKEKEGRICLGWVWLATEA